MATSYRIVLTVLTVAVVVSSLFFMVCPNTQAQTNVTFTPQDKFTIPESNGTVSFAVNGSCSAATLLNGTWTFMDLKFNSSQPPLGTLKISAENSNVTVNLFRATNFFGRTATLRYTVEGHGRQTVNLGLNTTKPTTTGEWGVNLDGKPFVGVGKGWKLQQDNTVVITGATKNATVTHYSFNGFNRDSNLPFYLQHSVAIITAAALALTVAIAVIAKVKVKGGN
jgi:hypothetical protein